MNSSRRIELDQILPKPDEPKKHPKCKGYFDAYAHEYDCRYNTTLTCDDCKYGLGRKDPEAKCNQG